MSLTPRTWFPPPPLKWLAMEINGDYYRGVFWRVLFGDTDVGVSCVDVVCDVVVVSTRSGHSVIVNSHESA